MDLARLWFSGFDLTLTKARPQRWHRQRKHVEVVLFS